MRFIAAWAVLVLGAGFQDPPKAEIGWNLKPGDRVRYEVAKSTLIHRTGATLEMKMTLGLVLEAAERDLDGNSEIKITIDRVAMSGSGDRDDEVFDSDAKKGAPKHPAMQLMAGCLNGTFSARISKRGAISQIRGLKEILEKAALEIPEMQESGDKEVASRFASSIDQILQEGFDSAAGQGLGKGDSWESRLESVVFGVGEAPVKIKSTVKEIRAKDAVIGRALEFDFSNNERNPDGKGTGTGEMTWSIERGILQSAKWSAQVVTSRGNVDVALSVKLAPRDGPKPAQDAAKVPIAWSLKKGDKVRYEFEYTIVNTLRAETGETKLVAGLVLEATEVAKDGTATVKAVFDRFAAKTSDHGRVEEYDSR